MRIQKEIIRRIMGLIKPYIHYFIISILFTGISVALTLYAPILIGQGIDTMIGAHNVAMERLIQILIRLGVIVAITAISQWLSSQAIYRITYNVGKDIRVQAFETIEKVPIKYIDSNRYGDIMSRIITDVDQFSDGLLMGFTQLFAGVMTIVGTIGFMISINHNIAIVVILLTPISLFVAAFIAKHTYEYFRMQSVTRGELTSLVEEMVGNQKVVKAFAREEQVKEKFSKINEQLRSVSIHAIFFSSLTNPCTRFVNGLVYTSVGIIGAFIAINGGITIGQLTSFLSYANQYTKPFNEISGVFTELQSAFASAKRVFDIIDEKREEESLVDVERENESEGMFKREGTFKSEETKLEKLDCVSGTVGLDEVSFSYSKDTTFIKELTLSVTSGQRIAIVGPTGCGKTTIINLLMRFYDVDAGAITVDGIDIRSISRDNLRKNFGMVLQETWLKAGTIKENIAYGKPDATMEEIMNAAKEAHAHSFIKRLPNGYDTAISEDGGNLSLGQKQLLCIARVMLSLPPILILDEATSSIDTRTEIKIQKAFDTMMNGRTSFVVAHRLSTIKEADVIVVMNEGMIIEKGTHKQLLEQDGFYKSLYDSQFVIAE